MRIGMIAMHGCIRVWKIGQMLRAEGHTIDLLTQGITGPNADIWNTWATYKDGYQLKRGVESLDASGVEVFHVHNEPDWIVEITRMATKKPVVWDIHDLESCRGGGNSVPKLEMNLFRSVDGAIHVSNAMLREATAVHSPKCPQEVIFTYSPESWMQSEELILKSQRDPRSVMYEGGIASPFGANEVKIEGRTVTTPRCFRDFGPVFRGLLDAGLKIHVYSCNEKDPALKEYMLMGCNIEKPVPGFIIPQAALKWQFTFVGNAIPDPVLLDKAMPNKLFEPMSGGAIPLVYCGKEAEKFVLENEFGVQLDSLDPEEIAEKTHPKVVQQLRLNFLKRRHEFTMESQYKKLMAFYRRAIEYNNVKEKPILIERAGVW